MATLKILSVNVLDNIDNIHVVKETALEKKLEKELLDCSWRTTVQYL